MKGGMVRCPNCGGKNTDTAIYCSKCGHPLRERAEESTQQPGWWSRQGCITKVIIVLVVLGVIGAIIGLGRDDDDTSSYRSSANTYSAARSTTTALDPIRQVALVSGTLEVTHNSIGYMELTGKVKNKGSLTLKFVKVRGYALTDSGATVNTDYSYIDSDILAPGVTSTYKIYVDDPNDEATRGRVVIEGARFAW